jgi:hypothetical protein
VAISPEGDVAINRSVFAQTFRVDGGASVYVRVSRLSGGDKALVACGVVDPFLTYEFPDAFDDWSVIDVDAYGTAEPDVLNDELRSRIPRLLADERKRLADARKKSAEYVGDITKWKILDRFARIRAEIEVAAAATPQAKDKLQEEATRVNELINEIKHALPCGEPERTLTFRKERCGAVNDESALLVDLRNELQASAPSAGNIKLLLGKLETAKTAPGAPPDHCGLEAKLSAIERSHPILRMLHVQIPAAREVYEFEYGRTSDPEKTTDEANLPILLRRVPAGRAMVMQTRTVDDKAGSPADVLSAFLPIFLKAAATGGAKAAADAKLNLDTSCDNDLALDADAEPVARFETRAFVTPRTSTGKTIEVTLCDGDKCTSDGATPSTRNVLTFNAKPTVTLALFLDLSANIGSTFKTGASPYGRPHYESASSTDTLTEAFVLQNQTDARHNLVTSALIGARYKSCMAAIGPGIVDLTGESAFNQYHLDIGYSPAKYFYITLNAGLAFVQRPRNTVPNTVVVPRTPEAEATEPAVHTTTKLAGTVGIGIAIDLAVFPDTGKDALKAMTGSK